MQTIIIFFFLISFVLICCVAFILLKNLPNNKERLKVIVPILASVLIAIVFYFLGWKVPRCSFGRFF